MKSIANVNKTVLIPIILIVSFLAGFLFGMNNRQEEHKILPSYDDTVNWEVIRFNDCPYCTAAKPVLGAVSYNNNDAVSIYYVDVAREERVEGNSTYDLTVEHFREFLKSDKMYVPYVVFIKEGRVLGGWTGTVDGHDLKTGLTSIQICQLYGIYTGLYNQIA